MVIKIYYAGYSAPCKAVLLTAKFLDIDVDLKVIQLTKMEHMTEEFIKINPHHKVPVMVESDGFTLAESRAIMIYLVEKYARNSSLYPEDVRTRAIINHRLYFDIGTVYLRLLACYVPVWKTGCQPDPYKKAKLDEALSYMDQYLQEQKYFAGDHITLADISLVATVSTMLDCKVDLVYDSIKCWYERMKTTAPGFQEVITDNASDVLKTPKF